MSLKCHLLQTGGIKIERHTSNPVSLALVKKKDSTRKETKRRKMTDDVNAKERG